MPVEIERKYLVRDDSWREEVAHSSSLRQGYLSTDPERTVRVRLVDGRTAYLTIKGRRVGDTRPEYEYEIPAEHAAFLLDHLCLRPLIEKVRHDLDRSPGAWTVDVFTGENEGLVLAEVELADGAAMPATPAWSGEDVTEDDRYANSYLQEHPYLTW
jgi:adenylate cyclase